MAARESCEVHVDDTWVSVHKPGLDLPAQGWKLHVSARPGTLAATLERVLPLLFHLECDFKVVRSVSGLREINSGDVDLGAVGKAITVYPPQDSVVKVGQVLAAALAGFTAPRVPSDRRVRRDAPVYYRYAPFIPQYRVDDNGDFELVLIGPDGEFLPGAAGPEFRCPPWTSDPFRPSGGSPAGASEGAAEGAPTLGGRYNLASGVVRGARGNVYRAEDTTSGDHVVIKEARAYVGENADGTDLRLHIRNERRILQALAGLDGVPGLIDHFRHGEDEYLVITEAGSRDLNRFVGEYGPFTDDPAGSGHGLGDLAAQLLSLLDAVHARGVVIRDLSPKNVVLDETGRCTLVDFGNSRYEDFQIPGWTPGYSIPDQRTGRPSEPSDDLFALGATLFFAATGMHPVTVDPDPVRAVGRTLMCLAARFPDADGGVVALIPGLLDLDPAVRSAAAEAIRQGTHRTPRAAAVTPAVRPPAYSADLLGSVIEHTAGACARFAAEMMAEPADHRSQPPQTNVHAGSAGLGMELLHHPATRTVAGDLARWTAEAAPAGLPAALYFGRTGTAVFLEAARTALGLDLPPFSPIEVPSGEKGDYIHGLAGIGSGHLLLGGPEHLAVAAECARRLTAGEATVSKDAVAPAQPGSGVAVESGFAHGEAGIAFFLSSYARATGDASADASARERFARLAPVTGELIEIMRRPAARPMGASWCQGMAGIAAAHLHAAQEYDDDHHLSLAREGARVCLAMAPQAWVITQCCGLAGIGELLIDMAQATDDEEFWTGAEHVFELILARSGGEPGRPILPGNSLDAPNPGWGMGSSGVLSFLRRLDRREGTRSWVPQWRLPA